MYTYYQTTFLEGCQYLSDPASDTHEHPEALLIMLHGLNTTGTQFAPIAQRIQAKYEGNLGVILPTAKKRKVGITGSQPVPGWFDLPVRDFRRRQDTPGIEKATEEVLRLIDNASETTGVPYQSIYLAGFSQGGCLALLATLASSHNLGGALSLSSWPIAAELQSALIEERADTFPIFLGQGREDDLAPATWMDDTVARLKQDGYEITRKIYPMAHTVSPQEVADMSRWLNGLRQKNK